MLHRNHLSVGLSQLTINPQPTATGIFSPINPQPAIYSGDSNTCHGFLLQCKLYFAAHPTLIKRQKLTIFMTLLSGEAVKWARALWANRTDFDSYGQFVNLFHSVFDHSPA